MYVDGVVADSEGALSVMLPLARNTIAIKFAEDDPDIAKMVAHAFIMFENSVPAMKHMLFIMR